MRLSLHPPAAVVTDPGTGNDPRPRAGRAGAELRQVITTRIAETRYPPRSVLELSLRYGPLEARRTAFSVALAIFWRMRSEAQQPRT